MELELIYKYSPYKTKLQLMQQFENINQKSGTLVVIYNLNLISEGNLEMDFTSSPGDIVLNDLQFNFDEMYVEYKRT
jgi:hypothetical protein